MIIKDGWEQNNISNKKIFLYFMNNIKKFFVYGLSSIIWIIDASYDLLSLFISILLSILNYVNQVWINGIPSFVFY